MRARVSVHFLAAPTGHPAVAAARPSRASSPCHVFPTGSPWNQRADGVAAVESGGMG